MERLHWVPESWYLGFVSNIKYLENPTELLGAGHSLLRARQGLVFPQEGAGWPRIGSVVFLGHIDVI